MSKFEKLLERIITLETDIRFEELKKILEYYGYEMHETKGGSSHCTFRKQGCMPITIPRHKSIKKSYVALVREVVLKELNSDEQND